MRYLARWRIQVAAHQLRKGDTPLARIALRSPSGYLAQEQVRLGSRAPSCEITTQRCRYMTWTMRGIRQRMLDSSSTPSAIST
jgi:hypothetical protein